MKDLSKGQKSEDELSRVADHIDEKSEIVRCEIQKQKEAENKLMDMADEVKAELMQDLSMITES